MIDASKFTAYTGFLSHTLLFIRHALFNHSVARIISLKFFDQDVFVSSIDLRSRTRSPNMNIPHTKIFKSAR